MRPRKKGRRETTKAYGWMRRIIHLMNSVKMEKIRTILIIPGSMQKTVFKQATATLSRLEAKAAMKLRSRLSWHRIST